MEQSLCKQEEIKAAKAAHLQLAETAHRECMHLNAAHSQQVFAKMKRFRRQSIFQRHTALGRVYRWMWALGVAKLQYVLIADYQMVCNNAGNSKC